MIERKNLLPKWIRLISWIFLVSVISPIILLIGFFVGKMNYGLFGISYYGSALHPIPIMMAAVLTFHGVTAFGLLWGKRWGLYAGMACGLIGGALSVIGMIMSFTNGDMHFEFSIIFQVMFLFELFNIREAWLTIGEPLG